MEENDRDSEGSAEMKDKTPRLVVLVLGWWLSSPKAVEKYADVYRAHDQVFEVVAVTYSSAELVDSSGRGVKRVLRALDEACERFRAQEGHDPLVVVQAMSNNGGKALTDLLAAVKKRKRRSSRSVSSSSSSSLAKVPNIRGYVLDSCPGDLTVKTGTGAILASQSASTRKLYLAVAASVLLLLAPKLLSARGLLSVGLAIAITLLSERILSSSYHNKVISLSRGAPKLFMYSNGDSLVYHTTVESVASAMEAKGDDVELCFFKDSPHVAHLRSSREQYLTRLYAFLDKVALTN